MKPLQRIEKRVNDVLQSVDEIVKIHHHKDGQILNAEQKKFLIDQFENMIEELKVNLEESPNSNKFTFNEK